MTFSKGKIHPVSFLVYTEGRRGYSPSPFATSAVEEMDGQHHASANLLLGRTRNPFYSRLGGLRVGLDGHGKSHLHQDSIPTPSNPSESLYLLYCTCRLLTLATQQNFYSEITNYNLMC